MVSSSLVILDQLVLFVLTRYRSPVPSTTVALVDAWK